MAKLIEIMGPVAVGKTTIIRNLKEYYKDSKVYGFNDISGKDPYYIYWKIFHSKKFKYIITEKRVLYSFILKNKGINKTISDDSILFAQKTSEEEGVEKVLEEFSNIYMMFNLKCDENILLKRMKLKRKADTGKYYNYLNSEEDKLRAIKNVMNYIDTISKIFGKRGIFVYDIDTSLEIEECVNKVKNILDYHRDMYNLEICII